MLLSLGCRTKYGVNMNRCDMRLRNELFGVIAIKVCLLALLWLIFVRDARVLVDASAMAGHVIPAQTVSTHGVLNAQR